MSPAKKGKKRGRKPSGGADPARGGKRCMALVWVDSGELRKKLLKKLRTAERQFEREEERWSRFQQHDGPAFDRWRHVRLGPLEQERADLLQRESLFSSFVTGIYQEAMIQRRRVGTLVPELLAFAGERDDGQPGNKMDGRWSPAYLLKCMDDLWVEPRIQEMERLRQERLEERARGRGNRRKNFMSLEELFMDMMMGVMGEDADELDDEDAEEDEAWDFWNDPPLDDEARSERMGAEAVRPNGDQSLRTIYRALCRELHPDVARHSDERTRQLWLEVQDAYEGRDLERLEALQAVWEMKVDPEARRATLARIMAATKECQAGLRRLRGEIRRRSRDASWEFAERSEKSREALAETMAAGIRREIAEQRVRCQSVMKEYTCLLSAGQRKPRAGMRQEAQGQGVLWDA